MNKLSQDQVKILTLFKSTKSSYRKKAYIEAGFSVDQSTSILDSLVALGLLKKNKVGFLSMTMSFEEISAMLSSIGKNKEDLLNEIKEQQKRVSELYDIFVRTPTTPWPTNQKEFAGNDYYYANKSLTGLKLQVKYL